MNPNGILFFAVDGEGNIALVQESSAKQIEKQHHGCKVVQISLTQPQMRAFLKAEQEARELRRTKA